MARARKQRSDAALDAGFAFGHDHGDKTTLLAVAAPIDKASAAVAAAQHLIVQADVYGKPAGSEHAGLGWQFQGNRFSHYLFRWLQPAELQAISRKLKALAVTYTYEDTSGWRELRVYEKGKCIETYAWGLGEERPVPTDDGKPFDHRVLIRRGKSVKLIHEYRFRSERRSLPAAMVSDENRMLDAACRFYGVLMPPYSQIPLSGSSFEPERGDEDQYVRVDLLTSRSTEDVTSAHIAFEEAVLALDPDGVQKALSSGAQPDKVMGLDGETAIHVVITNAHEDPENAAAVIRILVKAGLEPYGKSRSTDPTMPPGADIPMMGLFGGPLILSASIIPVFQVLLDAGTNVNAVGRGFRTRGDTALHGAATACCPGLVLFLLSRGADRRGKDRAGRTPLQAAQAALYTYEAGYPDAEIAIPKLHQVIEILSAAEQGKTPPGDWRQEYVRDTAAERPERERRAKRIEAMRKKRAKREKRAPTKVSGKAGRKGCG